MHFDGVMLMKTGRVVEVSNRAALVGEAESKFRDVRKAEDE